jgi:hypothetical protein
MTGAVGHAVRDRAVANRSHRHSRRGIACQWAITATAVLLPVQAIASVDACDAAMASLNTAQRSKFHLSAGSCATQKPSVTDETARKKTADAVVATSMETLSSGRAIPEPQARHLQLFDTQRTVEVPPVVVYTAQNLVTSAMSAPALTGRTPARGTPKPVAGNTLRALTLAPDVDAVARRHDIDPLLLHAIAHVESRHNAQAMSPAGARGVMQVMPATAKRFGVSTAHALQEVRTNLDVSAAYLKTLQQRFGNDLTLVLAAYNAGEGAVEKYGRRVPPFAETQGYVRQVLDYYRMLTSTAARTTRAARSDL